MTTTDTTEKIYFDHVNDWCKLCVNDTMARRCKKCYLPVLGDDGEIGRPSEFVEK